MKLAEALLERAELKQKLIVLQNRLVSNAKVQEGMEPNESPKTLLKELDEATNRLEFLITHINKTNELTKNQNGTTISELIAKRDVLTQKYRILRIFLDNGNAVVNRLTHTEIKLLTTFSVVDTQKNVDKLSEQIRKIDTEIQGLNWTTDLL